MSLSKYKQTLDELRERYNDIFQQRRLMKRELYNLAKSIEGLAALCGEESNIPKPGERVDTETAKLMASSV